MKNKIIVLLLVLSLVFAVALTACQQKPDDKTPVALSDIEQIKKDGKIVMATNAAFPPFEFLKDEKISGVDVDIAQAIADELGVELEVTDIDFDSIIPAVVTGKATFGAAGMTIKPDRLENVDFSKPYITSEQHIIVKSDSTIATAKDLSGKKIGVQQGTTGDYFATDEIENSNVSRYKTAMEAAMDLSAGRVDAVIIDTLPAQEIVKANEGLKYIETALTQEDYAICVKKGSTELIEVINKVIDKLIADDKIDEFVINHTVK